MVLPALLDLGIYSIEAGNGGENLKPGCEFQVSSGVLWAVHPGTEDIQVSVGMAATTLPFKSETCFDGLLSQCPPKTITRAQEHL